ncbi:MAG: prolipoprotein diacylglyceryl transferase [Nocardioidaceae bacterium]|nr:prolipoprotein diacylglyceryl transferase [Nocardioidaceae bacterium]
MTSAFIPSPSDGVWNLGPIPVRGYALCIIAGVIVAVWLGDRRWVQRGGQPGTVADVAVWAVPFGLVGGRLYHVLTDAQLYFGDGRDPVTAFYIWQGGLGIWGAIALGAVGAYLGARRHRLKFRAFGDAVAPGIALAQAIGRWGNWFNQELYGRPTTLPWGLEIDLENRGDLQEYETFHPTFLYESLWCIGVAALVIWAERRFRLGYCRAFALFVMAYTAGRVWIEMLRVDEVNHVWGLRLNVWTSIIVFALATVYFVVVGRRHPGRETDVQPAPNTSPLGGDDTPAGGATAAEDGATNRAATGDADLDERGAADSGTSGSEQEGSDRERSG